MNKNMDQQEISQLQSVVSYQAFKIMQLEHQVQRLVASLKEQELEALKNRELESIKEQAGAAPVKRG